ncbi:Tenascin-X [Melipona quadrifasciata]|uniref:Tenascin-X n=1 Tax=Melipona quadrifasciata TaxID=166423 RepID=A0A0N1IU73_9HYME|nr:Tenascin-X [Melipona quadrifasciata]
MLPVSIIVVLLLCISHNDFVDLTRGSTRAEELRSVGDEASLNNVLDWKCNATSDCAMRLTSCVNGICRCAPGYILDGSFTACIKVAQKYGDDCQESRQCSAYLSRGGTCVNGVCVCADGYYYIHGKCHGYSGLSEKCEDDEDCYVHGDFQAAECKKKICNCAPKYYKREYRSCRPIAEENDGKCIINNDCKGPNATCNSVEHKCVPQGNDTASKFLRNDNTLFREDDATGQELGERCDPTKNGTVIDNSVCRNGMWQCVPETVASRDNRECEKVISRYNDSCRNDVQCYVFGPDAICKGGKCVCNEKSRLNETELFCWMKRGIGENCYHDVDCYLDGYVDVRLICDANKLCSCPDGTYPTNDRTACVKKQAVDPVETRKLSQNGKNVSIRVVRYGTKDDLISGIGDTCGVDKDCQHTKNATCANKVCVCVDNYYELNKQCVKVLEYGEPCEKDIQCSSRIPNALCLPRTGLNSTCACSKSYYYNFGECFQRKGGNITTSMVGLVALLLLLINLLV